MFRRYVAFGHGLQQAGHSVRLLPAAPFAEFVGDHGLEFVPLTGKFHELMETRSGKGAFAGKANALVLLHEAKPIMRQLLDESWQAADDADAVIYHPKAMSDYTIAEKLAIAGILAVPCPSTRPHARFPAPVYQLATWAAR